MSRLVDTYLYIVVKLNIYLAYIAICDIVMNVIKWISDLKYNMANDFALYFCAYHILIVNWYFFHLTGEDITSTLLGLASNPSNTGRRKRATSDPISGLDVDYTFVAPDVSTYIMMYMDKKEYFAQFISSFVLISLIIIFGNAYIGLGYVMYQY